MNLALQCPVIDSTTRPTKRSTSSNILFQSQYHSRYVNNLRYTSLIRRSMEELNSNHSIYTNPLANNPAQVTGRPANNSESLDTRPDFVSTQKAIVGVAIIFVCAAIALGFVYARFPTLEPEEKQYVKLPWDIEDARNLGRVLARYKEKYYFEVFSGVCVTYIFLQTFAIPGSLFLSILSGFLFPFFMALAVICTCSALGASLCYVLSNLLGKRIVYAYFPDRANSWALTINKHRDNLLNYMLFLRITPFVPNWFINLTAPVIGVPMYPFVLGTFLGVAPPSFVAIQTGQTLYNMTSSSDKFSWTSVLLLAVFAVLSIIPVLFRDKFKRKFD